MWTWCLTLFCRIPVSYVYWYAVKGLWEGTRTLYTSLFVKNRQMIKKHIFWLKCHMVYLWVLMQGKCKLYNSKYKNIFIQLGYHLVQKTEVTSMILVSDLWFSVLLVRKYSCPYVKMSNMPWRHKGVEVLLHALSTSVLHGSGWTCWTKSWLDHSANLTNLDTWNISLSIPGINPAFLGHPVTIPSDRCSFNAVYCIKCYVLESFLRSFLPVFLWCDTVIF